jgi:hypothetical protein
LAKKVNRIPSDIDKSSFFFVRNCGACHPGGGPGEYDRKGNLYYDDEKREWGYAISGDDPMLDGDYTSFTAGNAGYGAPWERSGVSEADCLICHLKGYRWTERAAALKEGFFRYGPAVGAGWATVKILQDESGDAKKGEVSVDYARKEVSDFENLHLQIVKRPPDENCWFCHAVSDGRKKGRRWDPETDIHRAKGLDCVSCHPSDGEHNFTKGETLQETVRDDLTNRMRSCEDCHYRGKDRKAPRYRHPFSPRHMKRLACQVCHIPYQTASADLVYDHASTGSTIIYDTLKFLSNDPLDPKRSIPGEDPNLWYPAILEFKGRIVPVKSLVAIYWGDLDEKTHVVKPIPLWKIRELKRPPLPPLKDEKGEGSTRFYSLDEIRVFLKALKGKDGFGQTIANSPVLIKGGFLYRLDKKGEIEKIKHGQAEPIDFSLSHNIVSGSKVVGARGCEDCHSKRSPFFLRKILIDPFDEKGMPVYIEVWERLGIDREKLGRLLTEQ